MGYPREPVYPQLPYPGELAMPALREPERTAGLPAFHEKCGDRYRLATLDLSGFTVYTLLRGFENAMEDLLLLPRRIRRSSGPGDRLRVRVDPHRRTSRLRRHPLRRRLGHADRPAGFARPLAAGVPAAIRATVRAGPRTGTPRVVPFLRQITKICGGLHEAGVDVLNISQPNVVRYRGGRAATERPAMFHGPDQLPDGVGNGHAR